MKKTDFSKIITLYFSEYLPRTCGLSENTMNSYRDTFKLLLAFFQQTRSIEAHKIELNMLSSETVTAFLDWLVSAEERVVPLSKMS